MKTREIGTRRREEGEKGISRSRKGTTKRKKDERIVLLLAKAVDTSPLTAPPHGCFCLVSLSLSSLSLFSHLVSYLSARVCVTCLRMGLIIFSHSFPSLFLFEYLFLSYIYLGLWFLCCGIVCNPFFLFPYIFFFFLLFLDISNLLHTAMFFISSFLF